MKTTYAARVLELEEAGCTTSDAQGCADVELKRGVITSDQHVTAAVKTHSDGVTMGWTYDDRILLFASSDYDNRGTVNGPVLDITDICAKLGRGGAYKLYLD